jgi:hypothetical protein
MCRLLPLERIAETMLKVAFEILEAAFETLGVALAILRATFEAFFYAFLCLFLILVALMLYFFWPVVFVLLNIIFLLMDADWIANIVPRPMFRFYLACVVYHLITGLDSGVDVYLLSLLGFAGFRLPLFLLLCVGIHIDLCKVNFEVEIGAARADFIPNLIAEDLDPLE